VEAAVPRTSIITPALLPLVVTPTPELDDEDDDELEAADRRNTELHDLLFAEVSSWTQRYDCANSRREAAEKRIAELEAPDWTGEVSDEELNAALQVHRLKVDGHSQLSDAFRSGFKYARRAAAGKGEAS
jgi:hypothetical protein